MGTGSLCPFVCNVCVMNDACVFRDVLLQVLSRTRLVLCYKAKDFLCTALQFYKGDITWKQGTIYHSYSKVLYLLSVYSTAF